jgi:hypothetical protein
MVQCGKLCLQDCKLANHNQFPLKKQGASRGCRARAGAPGSLRSRRYPAAFTSFDRRAPALGGDSAHHLVGEPGPPLIGRSC